MEDSLPGVGDWAIAGSVTPTPAQHPNGMARASDNPDSAPEALRRLKDRLQRRLETSLAKLASPDMSTPGADRALPLGR